MNHEELVQVYKDTVLDVVDCEKSVIFLDTDAMVALPHEERAEAAKKQIEAESPELYKKLTQLDQQTDFSVFDRIASIKVSTVSASAHLIKGLDEFAVVTTPSVERDQVKEFIPAIEPFLQMAINVENFPATDKEMIMYVAAHEAAHIKTRNFSEAHETEKDLKGTILEEKRADKVAS